MQTQKVMPKEDNVLIKVLPVAPTVGEKVKFILPASVERSLNQGKSSKPYKGVVLAVGPGKVMPDGVLRPVEVAPGDVVIFDYYTGHDRVMCEGEEVAIVKEHDLKVVL